MVNWLFLFTAIVANVPFAQAGRFEALAVTEAVFAVLVGRYWWVNRRVA